MQFSKPRAVLACYCFVLFEIILAGEIEQNEFPKQKTRAPSIILDALTSNLKPTPGNMESQNKSQAAHVDSWRHMREYI